MKTIKRIIGKTIWNFSEFYNISLGKFAPICFGWMIGSKGTKIDKEEQ